MPVSSVPWPASPPTTRAAASSARTRSAPRLAADRRRDPALRLSRRPADRGPCRGRRSCARRPRAVLAGDSLRAIATDWNDRGIPTAAGDRWTVETLRRMLCSARLSGQREHRGEIVAPGQWEPILTPEETARLRAILDERTRAPSATGPPVPPVGRSAPVRPVRRRRSSPDPRPTASRRYVCAKGPGHSGCGRMAIMAEPVEAFLAEAVLAQLDTPAVAAALAGRGRARMPRPPPSTTRCARTGSSSTSSPRHTARSSSRSPSGSPPERPSRPASTPHSGS